MPPNSTLLFSNMVKTMRSVARRNPNERASYAKVRIGLPELLQLIDNEMATNLSIETSDDTKWHGVLAASLQSGPDRWGLRVLRAHKTRLH